MNIYTFMGAINTLTSMEKSISFPLFNIVGVMRITRPHTSYIPTLHQTFPYALVQSKPKGDFATVGRGAHAAYDHRRDQQPNDSHHRYENPQWLVAFIHSNFRV